MYEKTLLFVAMPNSIHTANWIKQITSEKWKIYIFSSIGDVYAHPELNGVVVLRSMAWLHNFLDWVSLTSVNKSIYWLKRQYDKLFPNRKISRLQTAITKLRPDLIHAMEMQAAGYLVMDAKKKYKRKFPPWLMTIWGSDIFLFSRLQAHKHKIHQVLTNCDYFSCECKRDVQEARALGFKGEIFSSNPVSGGFDLETLAKIRANDTATRRLIMLKGYQNWSGRALVGLRALERCEDVLQGYTIIISSATPEVALAAELFTDKTGISTKILTHNTPHHEMLLFQAKARISIGLSISDGISVSLLEALVMGSFPIQSCTACADEWIEHGVSGMIVPPNDPEIIEMAIRAALADDVLVTEAAEINWRVALDRLNGPLLKQKVVDMYSNILQSMVA